MQQCKILTLRICQDLWGNKQKNEHGIMQDHTKLKSQQIYVHVAETVLGMSQLFEKEAAKEQKMST